MIIVCPTSQSNSFQSLSPPHLSLSLSQTEKPHHPNVFEFINILLFIFYFFPLQSLDMWLWGSFIIFALEHAPIILLSNSNNGEANVDLYSSTPYVSAPSSLGSFEFEFSCGFSPRGMSSADELFLNGQIRPMSLLQTAQFQWQEHEENEASHHHHHRILELEDSENKEAETPSIETTPSGSASSSRSSSSGRNSKKWIFKVFTCSSSSRDEKEKNRKETETQKQKQKQKRSKQVLPKKSIKRRVLPSAHELHYIANRAQAEEMKKKTFLPY
ncbi:unnamed protein product [Camellia sinensis]